MLPWRLDAPLSREVVVPRGGARRGLVVLGGLRSGGSSTNAVEVLDTRTGALSPHGSLLEATHDAAGTTLGARLLVIGGGTTAPSGSTQIETGGRTTAGGALPQARADAGAVTIGRTAYVVGGYDGPAMDSEVVATTDGRRYRPVAALPVPVRYPALAALGSRIYVFGGLRRERPSQRRRPARRSGRPHGARGRPPASAARGRRSRVARWNDLPRGRPHRCGADQGASTPSSRAEPRSCVQGRCEWRWPTPAPP